MFVESSVQFPEREYMERGIYYQVVSSIHHVESISVDSPVFIKSTITCLSIFPEARESLSVASYRVSSRKVLTVGSYERALLILVFLIPSYTLP